MAQSKFTPYMYVQAYELARGGMSDEQIAKSLGVAGNTFRAWCRQKPALADALARARAARNPEGQPTFHQYVFDHLSPELREIWSEIEFYGEDANGIEMIDAMLKNHGVRVRQHLFLYALTQSMFNVSQSLRRLCIPRKTFEAWVANDPEFAELMDELHHHKKNFFESAFIGRVAAGSDACIIHAAKTQLRDRGYNDKIEIEHTGHVTADTAVPFEELDLDLDTRKKIRDAMRARATAIANGTPPVIDLVPNGA